ncbi:MAG: serine/threonine-protein kinase, partial [Thermoanaerobaculia bacterium]
MPTEPQALLYDHFEIERPIGKGAMGVVYLARDLRIGRHAALKTVQRRLGPESDPEAEQVFIRRFRREAELCGSLHHPNIVTLYEVGYEGGRIHWLAMEYVDGESLLGLLQRVGRLPVDAAARIALGLLQGLAYAHDRGVIHRDIKPANVMVTRDGVAKITDFGIARAVRSHDGEVTDVDQILGTPHYMAPERISGKPLDGRADLFSTGVVLYEMLSGEKPFGGDLITDVLYNVVNLPPRNIRALAPQVPGWVSEFLGKLLAKAPEDRFDTAADAARELRRLIETHLPRSERGEEAEIDLPRIEIRPAEETPTTPISALAHAEHARKRRKLFHRQVPTLIGVLVILVLLAGLAVPIGWIIPRIDSTPRADMTAAQILEAQQKQNALRDAKVLYESHQFAETVRRMDAYLALYPESPVAKNLRDRAWFALQTAEEERRREMAAAMN